MKWTSAALPSNASFLPNPINSLNAKDAKERQGKTFKGDNNKIWSITASRKRNHIPDCVSIGLRDNGSSIQSLDFLRVPWRPLRPLR